MSFRFAGFVRVMPCTLDIYIYVPFKRAYICPAILAAVAEISDWIREHPQVFNLGWLKKRNETNIVIESVVDFAARSFIIKQTWLLMNCK